jgi:hypothetical protein
MSLPSTRALANARGRLAPAICRSASFRKCRPCVRASQEPDAGTSESMSLVEAEQTLSVSRDESFETIMRAKEAQMKKAGQDQDRVFKVSSESVGKARPDSEAMVSRAR